ncbi:uncharacterized protein LOC133560836 [Nerophis ophidion]|uniref:uncharacterized protein LOC133560836 n=1 Tax=Nerophis ophidion TaxID=159077 RepID=UPI002AE0416D|nr:uncharacterized protein LOC133560836 [Nerophis ophidion]
MQPNKATPGASGMQAKLRPPPALFDEGPASSPAAPSVSGSSDVSYVPGGSSTSDPCESDGLPDPTRTPKMREEGCHKEPKYIIFESWLQSLVKWCHYPACGSQDISPSWDSNGTQLIMTIQCASCDQRSRWSSQPNIGPYAAGNILLSAGILFAGTSSGKVLQVLNSIGVVRYVKRTFFNHQELILQPAIKKVWEEQQRTHLTMLQVEGQPLVLGGDGQADSPGHSAKFGTYTTMELEANVVLDLQVVQSNECHGSYHVEMEGLKRMVEVLISWDLDVEVLVTDRHRQIAKSIHKNMPNTWHCYDIWHVAKSSTPPREGGLLVAKWKSVERHIQDIHKDHGDLFPICAHGQLHGRRLQKKWLKPSSRSAVKLEEVVNNKSLLKDIAMLSGYPDDLIREVVAGCRQTLDERTPVAVTVDVPPFLCDELEKPDKEEAIAKPRSRFAKR